MRKYGFAVFVLVFGFSIAILLSGCGPGKNIRSAYEKAVFDAATAEKGEIADNLIAINPQNENLVWNKDRTKILVVTWKSRDSYQRYLKPNRQTSENEAYLVWVTTVPQVQEFCRELVAANPEATAEKINLRLKQYLGLNVTRQYDLFVEMWVSPNYLFRPCVDPEINDSQCNLEFGTTVPVVNGIKNYAAFYKNLYYADFRILPGVPWTGLGYTFDWGNPFSEQGASEFILMPGATYEISRVVPTYDYCVPPK